MIKTKKPKVFLLHEPGLGTSEYAARTCYDSFELSENECIKDLNLLIDNSDDFEEEINVKINELQTVPKSKLLDDLAWTYFHHSILEHINLSYLIKGTSRSVLQEHARHRIQSISVRSTRYTMSGVINIFIASLKAEDSISFFIKKIAYLNLLITDDENYNFIEYDTIFRKLYYQYESDETLFLENALTNSGKELFESIDDAEDLLTKLNEGKKKRNVGDSFKHIVTDNWLVDMVVTFNLRSLKNYLNLRNSGAAYYQIRELAEEMQNATPKKYLDLIIKSAK